MGSVSKQERAVSVPPLPGSPLWRRFLRVNVRGLTVLVLCVGVALGWIVRTARVQREAVASISRVGGLVGYESDWRKARVVRVAESEPRALRRLVDLVGIDYVRCCSCFRAG
jgi:hypothetical protein